jgi:hypothetical protein
LPKIRRKKSSARSAEKLEVSGNVYAAHFPSGVNSSCSPRKGDNVRRQMVRQLPVHPDREQELLDVAKPGVLMTQRGRFHPALELGY